MLKARPLHTVGRGGGPCKGPVINYWGWGGEGHYIWGEGHYFLSPALGRVV